MKNFVKLLQSQFNKMCETGKLFKSSLSGNEVWEIYLSSFPAEYNKVFRDPQSTEHNCNNCKNFVRRYGNIVAIDENGQLMTIWDVEPSDKYKNSAKNSSDALRSSSIHNLFMEDYEELNSLPYEKCNKSLSVFQLGMSTNYKQYTAAEVAMYGVVEESKVYTFNHLHLFIPTRYIYKDNSKSLSTYLGEIRSNFDVLKRGLETISIDVLETVIELITQDSILNGSTYLSKVKAFLELKKKYETVSIKDHFIWQNCDSPVSKFRNELIGTLCVEIVEEGDLEKACKTWNIRVDPVNYKKAVAPITKSQIEAAKKFIFENGYEDSFNRRLAVLSDISVDEIKHMNVKNGVIVKPSIFDSVKPTKHSSKTVDFNNVPEISIVDFIENVLPKCTSVEAFFQNNHFNNLVRMTTSENKDSKKIFQWDNNFSWTYNGNIAGKSMIRQAIESRGGKTEGVLNIRLHFPKSISDYDLHVREIGGPDHICYQGRRKPSSSSGMLDLDAQGCDGSFPPEKRVENIIFTDISKMIGRRFKAFVHLFDNRDGIYNFDMEIEDYNGHFSKLNYNKHFSTVNIVEFSINEKGEIEYDYKVDCQINNTPQNMWNLDSLQFHKVNLVCTSPNHWGNNNTGNLHYFFMLENCKSDSVTRGFHNENLIGDLVPHRKVMEVLANTTMIKPTEEQLAGLGFNSTVRDSLIVRTSGTKQEVYKINF